VVPFVILELPGSLLVWSRVYFYIIIGIAASMAFFASPGKIWLINELKKRNQPHLQRTVSQETIGQPLMGLPSDPMRDIDEAISEIREEVETRRRRGSKITMPTGQDLKAAIERKLGKAL
jgi:lysophospholipid acyltransferase